MDSHAFTLGTLPVSGPGSAWIEAAGGYEIRALAGADFGNGQPIISELPSGLQDGSLERIDRWGNREMDFQVEVRATDARGLAQGEADVAAACATARTLTWLPPALLGVETIHDVHWARIETTFDDLLEKGASGLPVRTFHVVISAMPFPRGAVEVVTPAIGGGSGTAPFVPTPTVLNPATSLTGWSTNAPGGLAGGGALGVSNAVRPTVGLVTIKYTGTWTMSGDRWIRLHYTLITDSTNPNPSPPWLIRDSTIAGPPAAVIGEYAYFLLPAGVTSTASMAWAIPHGCILVIREVARQNGMPFSGTTRQLVRQFQVQGTARTQGSIELSHATMALGQTLVYTWPDDGSGYVPSIGDRLTSGTSLAVTDADAAMGRHLPLGPGKYASLQYDIPAQRLPEGTYSILLRAKRSAAGGVTARVGASTRLGGFDVGSQSEQAFLSWATTYRVLSVGQMTLPPSAVSRAATAATVRITVDMPISTETLLVDEVYLCNVDTGDLTLLDCGSGTPVAGGASKRAWINAPAVETPRSTIWVGTQADQSDARHIAGLNCMPALSHQFPPGPVNILTVSDAYDLAASLRHWPRFQHNAMEVAA